MILRNGLLFLSRLRWLRRWTERSRLTRRVIRRFVAGETLDQAIEVCRRLRREGILVTLDHLGENVSTPPEAQASWEEAAEAVRRVHAERLPATVSIKLTQFGLDLSEQECRRMVAQLAETARAAGTAIEIDMEASPYVDRTLSIARDVHAACGNVRVAIQAYLRRSRDDVERLCDSAIPVRLCKGAYLEPPEAAFPDKKQVDENYRLLMRVLFERGARPAIATHDASILREAVRIVESRGLAPDAFEFQMLYGVRRKLQRQLARKGYRMRLYVPYGVAWYPYFMRRLAERPANVMFLVRQLVRA